MRNCTVPGLTPGLKSALVSYGVETAADISSHSVDAVPGFGPVRTKLLVDWRHELERKFVFQPSRAVDLRPLGRIYTPARLRIQGQLTQGSAELNGLKSAVDNLCMVDHSAPLAIAYRNYKQAEADAQAVT